MNIIKIEPYQNGARPAIQTWHRDTPPVGYAIIPNSIDISVFYESNGFVNITVEDGIVTSMTSNTAAWKEWKATMPTEETEIETEPSLVERVATLETETYELTEALNMILEGRVE